MDKSTFDRKDSLLCAQSFDLSQTAEAGGEVTMPDYYPEIRRVVSVTAEALPDSKYLSDSNLEVGGTLAFNLLYIGDDGTLSSVPYVTEYSQHFPISRDFSGGSADIRTESTVESATCRPLAPRTVSLKAKIKSRAAADKSESCALICTNEDKSPITPDARKSLEQLTQDIPTVFTRTYSTTGNVTGEHKLTSKAKPIICRGSVLIDSSKCSGGAAVIKGEVLVSCLVLSGEGIYKTVHISLPIEERISTDGDQGAEKCASFGRVASISVAAEEDGTLAIDCEYDLDTVCQSGADVPSTEDIYSTEYTLETVRRDMKVKSFVCLEGGTVNCSGEGRRKSERGDGDHIISSSAEGKIDRVDVKDGKAVFTGSCNFRVYIASGGDVFAEEFSSPVRYECNCPDDGSAKDIIWHAHLSPGRVECSLEDSKLVGRCPMYIYAEAQREVLRSPVTQAVVGTPERAVADPGTIRICYPEKGRRIWDIAKECRAKMSECERQNKVNRLDLSDGSPLIVK